MARINILKMSFDTANVPSVGSIAFDREGEYLHLLGIDVNKLNSILVRSNIVKNYGTEFYFQTGDVAIVDDTQRAFVYNSILDSWTEWEL